MEVKSLKGKLVRTEWTTLQRKPICLSEKIKLRTEKESHPGPQFELHTNASPGRSVYHPTNKEASRSQSEADLADNSKRRDTALATDKDDISFPFTY